MATRGDIIRQDFDILVLGSGLAGLRAAWAALQAAPGARLAVVSAGRGPSGSSFANRHDKLGMQVPTGDDQRERFTAEVLDLAGGAEVHPGLVAAMAEEGEARFADLAGLGVEFVSDDAGGLVRYTGCFSPLERRAVVFSDLSKVYRAFARVLDALGAVFLSGPLVRKLLTDGNRACGALLEFPDTGEVVAARAQATVMALGGPAPLFAYNQAGPKNPGYSYGLLRQAGVRLVNEGWLQFMWARLSDRTFWPIRELARPGTTVSAPGKGDEEPPEEVLALAAERATHCPYGYGLPDNRLDAFLLDRLHPGGYALVNRPDKAPLKVAPMAHAGNGGALVDERGRTSLPGLYACGECAGGMHGANRMGGAMVLATQVFGRRAGEDAGAAIKSGAPSSDTSFNELVNDALAETGNEATRDRDAAWLPSRLQDVALTRDKARLERVLKEIESRRHGPGHWRDRLALETGFTLCNHFALHN